MEDVRHFLEGLIEKHGLVWEPSQVIEIYNEITSSLSSEQQVRMALLLAVTSYCDPGVEVKQEPLIMRP